MADEELIKKALKLAEKGRGRVPSSSQLSPLHRVPSASPRGASAIKPYFEAVGCQTPWAPFDREVPWRCLSYTFVTQNARADRLRSGTPCELSPEMYALRKDRLYQHLAKWVDTPTSDG